MKITATGNNVLRGTAQGILLIVVRGTDDALRRVKLSIVLVPGLNKVCFQVRPQLRKASKELLTEGLLFRSWSVQCSVDTVG